MSQPTPAPENGMPSSPDVLQKRLLSLEEENRALQDRLSGGTGEDLDLRLMRLHDELRRENERQARELESLGTQNVELAFQLDELEEGLSGLRREAEEARRALGHAQERLAELEAAAARVAEAEARAEALRQEVARQASESEELRQRLDGALQEGALAKEELARAQEALEEQAQLQAALDQARVEGERLREELHGLGESRQALQAELEASRGENERLVQEAEALRQELAATLEARQQDQERARQAEQGEQERAHQALEREQRLQQELEESRGQLEETRGQLEETRGRLDEAEAQAGEREVLQHQLGEAQARAAHLDAKLSELKRQFLERASAVQRAVPEQVSPTGVLAARLNDILGTTGKVLLDKVYGRTGLTPEARSPEDLEKLLKALEEPALRLCRNPEQRSRLEAALRDFRTGPALHAGEAAAASPAGQAVVEAPEAAAGPPPELPERPRLLPSLLVPLEGTLDAGAAARVAEGMELLTKEQFEPALEIFQELAGSHGDSPEVQTGLFYGYAGLHCWMEAYDAGHRLAPGRAAVRDRRFLQTMRTVLRERLAATRPMALRKRLLFETGELLLDQPAEALEFLRKAKGIPDPIPEDARIDFYLFRLLAGTPDDRMPFLLGALEGVAESLEPFESLEALHQEPKRKPKEPRARTVLALLREGREAAERAEAEAPLRVDPPEPALLATAVDPALESVLRFLLDEAVPRSGVTATLPSPDFASWDADAREADGDWGPAALAHRFDRQVFGFPELRVRRGRGPFLAAASLAPGNTLLLNRDLEEMPEDEVSFLVGRELFALHRRHVHLVAAARGVDGPARARLVRRTAAYVIESGSEVSHTLLGDASSLWGTEPVERIRQLLDRLYEHCLRDEFRILRDFLAAEQPFRDLLEREADRFALQLSGLTAASSAVARLVAPADVREACAREGFQVLYRPPTPELRPLRLRLQRIWAGALA